VVPFIFAGVIAAVRSRRMALVLVVAVLALLIGAKTELLTVLADLVPGWSLISNALRLSFVLTLPLALLAGSGIDLIAASWRHLWARIFAGAGLALSVILWLRPIHSRLGWHHAVAPLVVGAVALVLFLVVRRRTAWAVATVLGLALVAPLTASALTERALGWSPSANNPIVGYQPWLNAVARDNDPNGRWMSWCEPLGSGFDATTHRADTFLEAPGRWLDAYDSFLPTRFYDYWLTLTGNPQIVDPVGGQWYQDQPGNPPPNATLTDTAGVSRILAGNTCGQPAASLGWRRVEVVGPQTVWANDGAYPGAWVTNRWTDVPGGADLQALHQLAAEPPAFAGHTDQIEGATGVPSGSAPVKAQLERPSAEHLVAHLARPATGHSYLLVSEGTNYGWKATVDGHSRAILAADGDFQAIELKPGDQVVDIRFDPFSKRVLTPLSYILSGVLAALALAFAWRRRRTSDPGGTE
jgi:hypothetical protein